MNKLMLKLLNVIMQYINFIKTKKNGKGVLKRGKKNRHEAKRASLLTRKSREQS